MFGAQLVRGFPLSGVIPAQLCRRRRRRRYGGVSKADTHPALLALPALPAYVRTASVRTLTRPHRSLSTSTPSPRRPPRHEGRACSPGRARLAAGAPCSRTRPCTTRRSSGGRTMAEVTPQPQPCAAARALFGGSLTCQSEKGTRERHW